MYSHDNMSQMYKIGFFHGYRPEIPEPAPSLFRHGAQIGGIRGFPAIKITVIRHVPMYCVLSVKMDTHETPNGAQGSWTHFFFAFVSECVVGKNPNNPNRPVSHSARHQRPARERHIMRIASRENVDNQAPRNINFTQ